jgi:hypothetical protein
MKMTAWKALFGAFQQGLTCYGRTGEITSGQLKKVSFSRVERPAY